MKLIDIFESAELINESFKDAANIFSKQADPTVVNFYLNKFRELSNKNMLNGPEKDITTWVKQGFDKFKTFVSAKSQVKSNKELKSSSKLEGAIKVAEYSSWTVIAPLNTKASCQYGAGTRWCTSAKENNKFDQYFRDENITLFYLIPKSGHNKYAVAYNREDNAVEDIYDAADDQIDIEDLERYTKIPNIANEIDKWNQTFKPNEPASRTLDEKIVAADAEQSVDLFMNNKSILSEEQKNKLRKKIATNVDALIEYCNIFGINQNDELFIKTPGIIANGIINGTLSSYAISHLEDWIHISKTRSPALEKLFPVLVQKTGKNFRMGNLASNYIMKFGDVPEMAEYGKINF